MIVPDSLVFVEYCPSSHARGPDMGVVRSKGTQVDRVRSTG